MPYLKTQDDVNLFYRDWGTGRPVVLIHGWPLTGDMWEKQANYLVENGMRVIAYDRRGFGRSDQPWGRYDYTTLAADLSAVVEQLDLREAALVGFSMGGGEVVRYLSRYGTERVERAVLISAVTPYLVKAEGNPEGVDPKVFAGIDEGIRKDRPAFFHEFGPKFYGRTTLKHTVSEPVLEWTQSMAMTGSLGATLETGKAWSTTDFREEMRGLNIPFLVIHGTGDSTVPIDVSGRRSAKLLPNATLLEYDGEPHGLTLTAADRLNADLLDFLRLRGTAAEVREPVTDLHLA